MTALVALVLVLLVPQSTPGSSCGTWQECRARALEAAERRDFETFHDLAWRAVRSGPRNDPSLMQVLARAQSLSGRPGDALVMLQRLAAMGVATDVAGDDFAPVRRLARWPELQTQLEAVGGSGVAPPAAPAALAGSPPAPPAAAVKTKPVEPEPGIESKPSITSEALRFSAPRFTPGGFAYDAVSRRFIVGHREARKLSVVDEFSRHIANLAGAQAAGFADVTALEIDPRDGTLWVVSAGAPAAGATAPPTSLHKLQLISGRSLASFAPTEGSGARFVDVSVSQNRAVLVLDAQGRRLFRLAEGTRALEVVAPLGDIDPTSLAPASGSLVFVAHAEGIARVDLSTRKVTPVAAGSFDLTGVDWLRWHNGALIALQRTPSGHRVLRLRPNGRGAVDVLDDEVRSPGRATAAISRDVLYVLSAGTGSELVIERLPLNER